MDFFVWLGHGNWYNPWRGRLVRPVRDRPNVANQFFKNSSWAAFSFESQQSCLAIFSISSCSFGIKTTKLCCVLWQPYFCWWSCKIWRSDFSGEGNETKGSFRHSPFSSNQISIRFFVQGFWELPLFIKGRFWGPMLTVRYHFYKTCQYLAQFFHSVIMGLSSVFVLFRIFV